MDISKTSSANTLFVPESLDDLDVFNSRNKTLIRDFVCVFLSTF